MKSEWQVRPGGESRVSTLADLEHLLYQQRSLDAAAREAFLQPVYTRDIHDPHLLYGMQEAVDRIYRTVEKDERILVYGDYDVDGISSTAIMVSALQDIGANVTPYLPHRTDDGYGVNRAVLEKLEREFDLLITVDCGVSNVEEINWLASKGKDTIVVDHHELPKELPAARAILHPRHPKGSYPWPSLCGAGMSWKLSQALLRDERSPYAKDPDREKWLLDLALLGTIGDVMPLLGENRVIVKFGIEVLRRTRRPGLQALLDGANLSRGSLRVQDIAFRVIPLINAAGRIDHPQAALDLLLAPNMTRAIQCATELMSLNKERQAITRRIVQEAERQVDPRSSIVFAADTTWPAGIVGLVAGQLASKFSRPAFILGGNGKHAVGSARTANRINILEGLRTAEEYTLKLGGHIQAAGFSVEETNIAAFREQLQVYFDKLPEPAGAGKTFTADALVDPALLSWETNRLLEQFAPFGEANPAPLFVLENMSVLDVRPVGKEGKHVKLTLATQAGRVDAIGFGLGDRLGSIDKEVDVLGSLETNEFRGSVRLQLSLKDVNTEQVLVR
ncbi:MAG: single-stranded-DNA-specific exonuclease RecJ [Candidatus Andersenbacteria bacterium]